MSCKRKFPRTWLDDNRILDCWILRKLKGHLNISEDNVEYEGFRLNWSQSRHMVIWSTWYTANVDE
jgi:hypothetical protein